MILKWRSRALNRARDPEGKAKTIFKENIIGDNLKESLLILFNKLEGA